MKDFLKHFRQATRTLNIKYSSGRNQFAPHFECSLLGVYLRQLYYGNILRSDDETHGLGTLYTDRLVVVVVIARTT